MTGGVTIGIDVLDEMSSHAVQCRPLEACGLLVGRVGVVERFVPTRNVDESATAYTVDPEEHYRVHRQAEEEGVAIVGVFHSHPVSPAVPSASDVAGALEPEWVYLIHGTQGEFRAWNILDGRAREVPILTT